MIYISLHLINMIQYGHNIVTYIYRCVYELVKSPQSSSSAAVVLATGSDAAGVGRAVKTVDPGAGGGLRNPLLAVCVV